MNKSLQINLLQKMLKRHGLDADLVDLEHEVDSTLSLDENARIIKQSYGLVEKQSYGTSSTKKLERFLEAVEIFSKKSYRSQRDDSVKRANNTFSKDELNDKNFGKWKKDSAHYDIEGVDSKG